MFKMFSILSSLTLPFIELTDENVHNEERPLGRQEDTYKPHPWHKVYKRAPLPQSVKYVESIVATKIILSLALQGDNF